MSFNPRVQGFTRGDETTTQTIAVGSREQLYPLGQVVEDDLGNGYRWVANDATSAIAAKSVVQHDWAGGSNYGKIAGDDTDIVDIMGLSVSSIPAAVTADGTVGMGFVLIYGKMSAALTDSGQTIAAAGVPLGAGAAASSTAGKLKPSPTGDAFAVSTAARSGSTVDVHITSPLW